MRVRKRRGAAGTSGGPARSRKGRRVRSGERRRCIESGILKPFAAHPGRRSSGGRLTKGKACSTRVTGTRTGRARHLDVAALQPIRRSARVAVRCRARELKSRHGQVPHLQDGATSRCCAAVAAAAARAVRTARVSRHGRPSTRSSRIRVMRRRGRGLR